LTFYPSHDNRGKFIVRLSKFVITVFATEKHIEQKLTNPIKQPAHILLNH